MDLGSPTRQQTYDDIATLLPNPEGEGQRSQCSICCAAKVSGLLFGVITLIGVPFNAAAHGFRPPPVSRSTREFRHPLAKNDYSANIASSGRHIVTEGGGLYAKAAETGGMDFLGGKSVGAPRSSLGALQAGRKALPATRTRTRLPAFYFDRFLFHSLPFACVAFTHQIALSQLMWSKSEKDLFTLNTQSLAANTVLWVALAFIGRVTYRRFVLPRSAAARFTQFEYERIGRLTGTSLRPLLTGQLSCHFDIRQVIWMLAVYNFMWGTASMVNEHLFQNHYSMFHSLIPSYSIACAPRWREWRENQIRRQRLEANNGRVLQNMGEGPSDKIWGVNRWSRPTRVQ